MSNKGDGTKKASAPVGSRAKYKAIRPARIAANKTKRLAQEKARKVAALLKKPKTPRGTARRLRRLSLQATDESASA